jgi:hypothetical protein
LEEIERTDRVSFRQAHERDHITDCKPGTKVYGGYNLFAASVRLNERLVTYQLGRIAGQDISGQQATDRPYVATVFTTNSGLASIPLDIGVKHFRASGDPRVAALYCAEAADYVNAQILERQIDVSNCGCDVISSKDLTHHCHGCLQERTCATLSLYDNSRLCTRCMSRTDEAVPDKNVAAVMNSSIRRNHKRECKALGTDIQSADERRILNDMVLKFANHNGQDDTYNDDYASITHHVLGFKSVRARDLNPFICSVDATEPYGKSHGGTMRVHTKDNVAMSTAGYNLLKYTQVLGFLVELGKYDPSLNHTMEQQRQFESLCNDFYLVSLKTPHTGKARLQGRGLKDLRADQAEWRRGKPVLESGPWTQALWKWSLKRVPNTEVCEWDDETVARLSRLADEIQRKFGKELQTVNGCPWITEEGGNPPPVNWSWACWAVAMRQRLDRMTKYCNRYGISKLLLCALPLALITNQVNSHRFVRGPFRRVHVSNLHRRV